MILRLATWLSKPSGFLATCAAVAAGLAAGIVLGFNDSWALLFNLFLSIAALLIAGMILVAGAKDTIAIQVKLDELIRSHAEARNELIGAEKRTAQELEAVRCAG